MFAVAAGVFVLALGGLAAQLALDDGPSPMDELALALPVVLAPIMLLGALGFASRAPRLALLWPATLAPLAALTPWVLAPSGLGPSLGGAPFFVSWLTRYPTALGVNVEVALGMGAMLGACAVPGFAALHTAWVGEPSRRASALLGLAQLVSYTPVLIVLDAPLLAYAALCVPESGLVAGLLFGGGALARGLGSLSVLVAAGRGLRARAAPARPA